jgi:CheY-like chemotaxis protein
VLVIEDDLAVRSVICRALQRVGHTVLEGFDGRDGFDQVLRSKVDLVITDILMPNQEGIETIQQLKSLEPDLPIIAMSGVRREGPFSVLDDALMIGADLALEKPFDVPTLSACSSASPGSSPPPSRVRAMPWPRCACGTSPPGRSLR